MCKAAKLATAGEAEEAGAKRNLERSDRLRNEVEQPGTPKIFFLSCDFFYK
jgi:hypothetical protein